MKNVTSYKSEWSSDIGNDPHDWRDFIDNFYNEEWQKLDSSEKAVCLNYVKQLKKGNPPRKMINEISNIYEKYPDFDVSCIPEKKQDPIIPSFKTMDFSNYLPEVNQ